MTTNTIKTLLALLLAVSSSIGCGDDDTGEVGDTDTDTGTDTDADTDTDTDIDTDTVGTIHYTLGIFTMDQTPIEGAEVCWDEGYSVPCETTGSDGQVMIELPESTAGIVGVEHADYLPTLHYHTTSDVDEEWFFTIPTPAEAEGMAAALSVILESDKGIVVPSALTSEGSGYAGATVSLDPEIGDGPFYADETGVPSLTATETVEQFSWAGYFNVDPGEYDALVTAGSVECTSMYDHTAGPKTIDVIADTMITVSFECTD